MKIHHLKDDITVFGNEIKDFPDNKKDAWEGFINLYEGQDPVFYGIGEMNGSDFTYYVAATQKARNSTGEMDFKEFVIEKGDYLTLTLEDWPKK